mgnify:CR=1 FL=1
MTISAPRACCSARAVSASAAKPVEKAKAKEKTKAKTETKVKAKTKTKASRPKVAKPAKPAHDFDFIGKVESLLVKSGAGAEGFAFGLRGRHGKRRNFRFDSGDAFAMNAMAHLVLAAHASDSKIGVRTGSEVDGVLIVRELESRPKLGKHG